jgi:aspartyl protease family protein
LNHFARQDTSATIYRTSKRKSPKIGCISSFNTVIKIQIYQDNIGIIVEKPENKSPWRDPLPRKRADFHVGMAVWLLLAVAAGVGLWGLFSYFPGSLGSQDNQMSFVHGIALLALISSGLLFSRRIEFNNVGRNIAIWIGVAFVLILGYSYQEEIGVAAVRVKSELLPGQPSVHGEGVITLTKGSDRHFHVTGLANGSRINFLIDTGATGIALSPADASRIGIDLSRLEYTRIFETANGRGRGAPWRLDTLSIGPIEFRDVAVTINQADMNGSLLGMSFLDRLGSYEVLGRKMILRQ